MHAARNLGIDLGSTSCRAAYHDGDTIVSIPMRNEPYRFSIPLVNFDRVSSACRVVYPSLKQSLHLRIARSSGSPEPAADLVGEIFRSLRHAATRHARVEPDGAVVTVGASLSSAERALLGSALARAGFKRARVVSDALATARSFCNEQSTPGPQTLLVYSEGYMGADATIVRCSRRRVHEIAIASDTERLGGRSIDEALIAALIEILLPRFQRGCLPPWLDEFVRPELGPVLEDPGVSATWSLLRQAVERAKESITSEAPCALSLPVECLPRGAEPLLVELDHRAFAELMAGHHREAAALVQRLLDSSGLSELAVDRVLLVGGPTRDPTLLAVFAALFGRERVTPQSGAVIAEGAALIAAELTDADQPPRGVPAVSGAYGGTTAAATAPPGLLRVVDAGRQDAGSVPRARNEFDAEIVFDVPERELAPAVAALMASLGSMTVSGFRLADIAELIRRGRREEAIAALEVLDAAGKRLLESYSHFHAKRPR